MLIYSRKKKSNRHKFCKKINLSHKYTQEILRLKFGGIRGQNLALVRNPSVCNLLGSGGKLTSLSVEGD